MHSKWIYLGSQDLQIKGQGPHDYFVEGPCTACPRILHPPLVTPASIKQLVALQRAFTRKITGMCGYNVILGATKQIVTVLKTEEERDTGHRMFLSQYFILVVAGVGCKQTVAVLVGPWL